MLALPVVLLLGACAAGDVARPPGPSGSASASGSGTTAGSGSPTRAPSGTPTADTPSASPSGGSLPRRPRPTAPPKEPTDVPPLLRLVGVVEARGEGCVELTTDLDVSWALFGDEVRDLTVGTRVEVTGRELPTVLPTCAGAPLRVASVVVL